MQNITLSQAFLRIKQASSIIINKAQVISPTLTELTKGKGTQFFHLCWQEDNQERNAKFTEQNNQEVIFSDREDSMLLRSEDNIEVHLTLRKPATGGDKRTAAARSGAKVSIASAKRNR